MENEHKYNSIEYHIQHELTSSDKEYAAIHLNETDETRETTIAEIRRWIDDEMHIQIGKKNNLMCENHSMKKKRFNCDLLLSNPPRYAINKNNVRIAKCQIYCKKERLSILNYKKDMSLN